MRVLLSTRAVNEQLEANEREREKEREKERKEGRRRRKRRKRAFFYMPTPPPRLVWPVLSGTRKEKKREKEK